MRWEHNLYPGRAKTDATVSAQHSKGNKQAEDEANKDAEQQIKQIKDAGKTKQDAVVKKLLAAVFEVNPVAPSAA